MTVVIQVMIRINSPNYAPRIVVPLATPRCCYCCCTLASPANHSVPLCCHIAPRLQPPTHVFPAPRLPRYCAPTPRCSHRSADRCPITTTPLPSEAGTGMLHLKSAVGMHVRRALAPQFVQISIISITQIN